MIPKWLINTKNKIENFFYKISPKWLQASNRYKHIIYAIPVGFLFGELCVLGLASGMEFKDKMYGGKWDWIDWLCTMFGGAIGQAICILIF